MLRKTERESCRIMTDAQSNQLGRLRSFLWPIHRHELGQYLPIFLITFLLGVNYHILRNVKYGLLVLAPDAGAEAIPFVQLWGLIPGALLMTWALAALSRRWTQSQVFYVTVAAFLAFFGFFQFVLYPLREQLEPTALVAFLHNYLPTALNGFVAIVRHWVISLFYVASELWKVSVLAVLFWGFVNTSLPLAKASRFYGPLMVASALSGLVGGKLVSWLTQSAAMQRLGVGEDAWGRSLSLMTVVVILVGCLTLLVFRYLERRVPPAVETEVTEKKGFSVKEAFQTLRNSPYLLLLGFIVAADYIAFGLAEILWKDQLKQYFPNPCDFTAYMGEVIFWASILSLAVSLLLSGGLISRVGWGWASMIPPIILLGTSVAFYACVIFPETGVIANLTALFWSTPLAAAVFLGAVHNCLCRVVKYSLLDPTKELAFVPLDRKTQIKGKMIIDGIGVHTGRAGGALVQQLLLLGFPTVAAGAPLSLVVVLVIGLLWVRSVVFVGRRFTAMTAVKV